MELDHIGGTFGGNTKPCVFLQLVLKARSSLPLLPRPQARHPPECVYRCLCTDPHLVHTSGVVQCIRTGTIFHSGFNRLCSTQAGLITTSSLNPEPSPLNGLNPTPSHPPAHASSNWQLLQIQPEKEIIVELIKNEDFKYVRALGAFYMRMVAKPLDVYQYLEPLLNDYRKLRIITGLCVCVCARVSACMHGCVCMR